MRCGTEIRCAPRSVCAGLLLFTLVCACPGFARQSGARPQLLTASISGEVSVASAAGATNHLAGISVTLTASAPGAAPQTTATDGDGHYAFLHLPEGRYVLGVTVAGFKPWMVSIALGRGQADVQDAALQITSDQLFALSGSHTPASMIVDVFALTNSP